MLTTERCQAKTFSSAAIFVQSLYKELLVVDIFDTHGQQPFVTAKMM
jgi:hypothetical protein